MNNETNLEQIESNIKAILCEMREEGHTGPVGATEWVAAKMSRYADRLEAALDDPGTVFAILRDFHDAHYSVFPRDELTERLCHAFYDQFVEKPEVKEPAPATIQIDAFAFPDGAEIDGADDDEQNPRRPFLFRSARIGSEWRWQPTIDVETGIVVGWPRGTVAHIYDKPADDCAVLLDRRNLNNGGYVPAFLRPGHDDDDYIVMNIDGEGKIAGWNAAEAKAWVAKALIEAEGGAK